MERDAWLLGWAGIAAWGAAFGCLLVVGDRWPTDEISVALGFVGAFAALSAAVAAGGAAAAVSGWSRGEIAAAAVVAAGVAAGANQLDGAPAALLMGAALLAAGSWVGAGLGRGVQEAGHLWPLVAVAVGADIWSVTTPSGFTNQVVVEGRAPALLSFIVLSVPVPGIGVQPVLGVGDILFTALLLGAVDTLGLSMRRCVVGLGVGYALTLACLLVLELPIPALPFIAVAAVAALGREAPLRAREMAVAGGFVGLLFAGRHFLS